MKPSSRLSSWSHEVTDAMFCGWALASRRHPAAGASSWRKERESLDLSLISTTRPTQCRETGRRVVSSKFLRVDSATPLSTSISCRWQTRTPTCDRQTDRHDYGIYRASMASRSSTTNNLLIHARAVVSVCSRFCLSRAKALEDVEVICRQHLPTVRTTRTYPFVFFFCVLVLFICFMTYCFLLTIL